MNIESIIGCNFNGIISVRKNNEVIFKKPYGFADIINKIPNEIDT